MPGPNAVVYCVFREATAGHSATTFYMLFEEAVACTLAKNTDILRQPKASWQRFPFHLLDKRNTYMFELCHPAVLHACLLTIPPLAEMSWQGVAFVKLAYCRNSRKQYAVRGTGHNKLQVQLQQYTFAGWSCRDCRLSTHRSLHIHRVPTSACMQMFARQCIGLVTCHCT